MKTTSTILIIALLAGCAGASYRPMIDARGIDMNRFETDLRECQAYAAQLANAAQTAMAGAALGAILGAALAAAAGGNRYQTNRVAAVGAVSGGAQGAAAGETNQRVVIQRCLAGRGYSVLQ